MLKTPEEKSAEAEFSRPILRTEMHQQVKKPSVPNDEDGFYSTSDLFALFGNKEVLNRSHDLAFAIRNWIVDPEQWPLALTKVANGEDRHLDELLPNLSSKDTRRALALLVLAYSELLKAVQARGNPWRAGFRIGYRGRRA